MEKHPHTLLDTEQERQRLVHEFAVDHGPAWGEQYVPGSFGCHELMDRTTLLADTVEHYILTHPSCVQNQAWFALAEQAVIALRVLYQQIGEAHLAETSPTKA